MRNQVRIIAGQWRGRKISFPDKLSLRPTPNRVKETLFNWLAPCIVGARCLELFAGSASLSFEALSRQASLAVAVEKDREVVETIKMNAQRLMGNVEADGFALHLKNGKKEGNYVKGNDIIGNLEIIHADCVHWLATHAVNAPFDIAFVDPPYADPRILECLDLLNKRAWLSKQALVYFETDLPMTEDKLKHPWKILKEKKAGQVYYYLTTRAT